MMPYATVNHLKMYYEIEGKGHPLILIQGYTSDLSSWDFVRRELSRHFQLLLFDNRGAGRTECPDSPFSIDQMALDTIELSRHLGLKKPHVLGHSMGGMIAQSIAFHYPSEVGKSIFSQTRIKLTASSISLMETLLELRESGLPSKMLTKIMMPWLLSNTFLGNRKLCEQFIERREQFKYPISLNGHKKQLVALKHFDSSSWYQKIRTETLILCGEEDLLCPPQDSYLLEKGIPSSKIYVFKHLGHMSQFERPEEFCSILLQFLKDM
jgi:pimeloyl-ACP methyl ester carboxylesterase